MVSRPLNHQSMKTSDSRAGDPQQGDTEDSGEMTGDSELGEGKDGVANGKPEQGHLPSLQKYSKRMGHVPETQPPPGRALRETMSMWG